MSYASIFAPGLFAGKVIVVTGGGSGIGRCVAHELAALGAQIALLGRKIEKLERVAAEMAQDGVVHPPSLHVCDIRQEDAVRSAVAAIAGAAVAVSNAAALARARDADGVDGVDGNDEAEAESTRGLPPAGANRRPVKSAAQEPKKQHPDEADW